MFVVWSVDEHSTDQTCFGRKRSADKDGSVAVSYDGSSSLPVFTNTYVEPGQPETPGTPEDPGEPSQPGGPSKPTQPGGSNGSGGSEIPDAGCRANTPTRCFRWQRALAGRFSRPVPCS